MDYQRAVESPNRGFVIGATIGGGALGACAMIAVAIIIRMPSDPVAAPALTPIANVTVVPAAPVIVQVPAPVAETPAEPSAPPVRASAPFLQAHCVYGEDAPDLDRTTCDWDDGFPAISPDGKTIAMKHSEDDSGRGNANLRIELFDTTTGKRLRSITILSVDEFEAKYDELQTLLRPRVTKVNTLLADYRSLTKVGGVEDEPDLEGGRLVLEQQDAIVRVVDTQTQTAIYHRDFTASVVYPEHVSNPDTECSGLAQLGTISAWWDEATRTIVSSVYYAYGGCMCGGQTDTFVKRLR